MLELSSVRKNKINLSDYDCEQDIQNRMLMSDFSSFDVEVLEEILYSPLKIAIKKLARALQVEESNLLPTLQKFSAGGILAIEGDSLLVDKERRKYFEFQIARFSPDFKPDMEFIQGIWRKVPIHVLPTWYSIPRTSNNIFESIIEKYLLTPQIYQRYLQEPCLGNPTIHHIIQDLFASPDLKVSSTDLIAKYNLDRREFEEILLLLEFSFICCLIYEKEEDHWIECITPFQEWKEYLLFLRQTEAPTLEPHLVSRTKDSDFACIEEMSATQTKEEWLAMTPENRALFLYRHSLPPHLPEKSVREAEKSVKRVLHGKWVLFEDFFKGVLVSLNDAPIALQRTGKHWKYILPSYTEAEKALIKATLFEWLFELGMVATGTYQGQDCFCVTPFGRSFFED